MFFFNFQGLDPRCVAYEPSHQVDVRHCFMAVPEGIVKIYGNTLWRSKCEWTGWRKMAADCVFQAAAAVMIWFQSTKTAGDCRFAIRAHRSEQTSVPKVLSDAAERERQTVGPAQARRTFHHPVPDASPWEFSARLVRYFERRWVTDGTVTLIKICSGAVDCRAMAMDQLWGVAYFRRQRQAR